MSALYQAFRPLIFKLKPEPAHHMVMALLRLGGEVWPGQPIIRALFRPRRSVFQPVQAFGLTFPNPIGLAAGFDKDATAFRGLACLGFGHIEVGTVTPRPQPGNPQPRLFRLVEDEGVINRMGFNNRGADAMAARLKQRKPGGWILGVNIGKNKTTPAEDAAQDYLSLRRSFAPLADYLAVNISSPNTPGLRDLQARSALEGLLLPLAKERALQVKALGRQVPVLVKLAPDLDDAGLDDALEVITAAGMDGVIICNTTLGRDGLRSRLAAETGGLSGIPLRERSTAMVRQVVQRTGGRLPVIASGGVFTTTDAQAKLDAGAVLVQVYTGMIYQGPETVKEILEGPAR